MFKHGLSLIILWAVLGVLVSSCQARFVDQGLGPLTQVPRQQTKEEFLASLTDDELSYLQELRAKGGLRAGIPTRAEMISGSQEAARKALGPRLLEQISLVLDLPYEFVSLPLVDVLGQNGVIPPEVRTNPNLMYTPDAFSYIDVALTSLTPLPWRIKLLRYVPVLPNQVLVVVRKEDALATLGDLKTFEFLIPQNTSYAEQYAEFVRGVDQAPPPKNIDVNADYLGLLQAGEGRAVMVDSSEFFLNRARYPGLVPVHGVSALHYVGWVTARDNAILPGILSRTLAFLFSQGTFQRVFTEAHGIVYKDYEQVVGVVPGQLIHEVAFSLEELEYIDSLRKVGTLPVAMIPSEESYRVGPDGTITGFDYHMVLELATLLGLTPSIRVLDSLNDFWTHNGSFDPATIQDTTKTYKPDLLQEVILYAAPFGVNEWRLRLVDFVPLHPAGISIFGNGADKITDYTQLSGKRIAVSQGGFQAQLLKSLVEEYDLTVQEVIYDSSADNVFNVLREGRADLTIDGSIFIASGMQSMEGFSISPLKLSVVSVAWGLAKDNQVFQGIVKKFIDLSLATRSFHRYWEEAYGVPFDFYLKMVE